MGRLLRGAAMVFILAASGMSPPAAAGEGGVVRVSGEVYYLPRIALPPTAELYVAVEDVSRMDVPATVLAARRIAPAGRIPIAFALEVDAARIDPRHTYALRARIEDRGRLMWINTERGRLRLDGSDRIRVRVDPVGG